MVGRDRACKLLGVESHVAPDERRRACLAQLDEADFDPPAAWHDSVDVLIRPGRTSGAFTWHSIPALYEEAETGLSEEIEEFAARLLGIEPAERTRIWTSLSKRAEFSPALKRRLALLEAGLHIVVPEQLTSAPDRQGRLIRWVLAFYTSRLPTRTAIWIVACDAMCDSPEDWGRAADGLASQHPEIAQLAPELVDNARSWKSQRRVVQQRTKSRRREVRRKRWARWRSYVSPGDGSSRWIIVVAVVMGIRFAGSSLRHVDFGVHEPASRRSTYQFPKYSDKADLRFESETGVDSESLKEGFRAYRMIEEIKKRRALKQSVDSGLAGGAEDQFGSPALVEPVPSPPAEPQDDEPSDQPGA